MRLRRILGISLGLVAAAAFTIAYAQQPGASAQNPPGAESLPAGGATAPAAQTKNPSKKEPATRLASTWLRA